MHTYLYGLAWAVAIGIWVYAPGCRERDRSSNKSQDSIQFADGTSPDYESWVLIGAVGGTDRKTQHQVESVLKANVIDCLIEGSVVYGVRVPPKDKDRATTLLKADATENGYWIQFADGTGPPRKVDLQAKAQPATRPASETAEPTLPTGDPAICVWDGGIHMLGIKPYVVFAVWKDGIVLRRDAGRPPKPGKLRIGQADPAAVARLLADCDAAGFYDPPVRYAVRTDGPERRICLRDGGRRQVLAYHDRDEWEQGVVRDLRSSPGCYEMARFIRLWRQARAGIDALKPADQKEYGGPVLLEYPAFGDELARRAGAIGPLPAPGPGRTEALIAKLNADAPAPRCAAADALRESPDPKAIEPLMSVLDDPYLDGWVHHLAAWALWGIGEPAIPRLVQGLTDDDPVVRRRCAEVLGLIISEKGVEPLIAALEDRDASVRREVVRALGTRQAEQAAPKLIAALADHDTQVRAAAARALWLMRVKAARPALVQRLVSDREAEVRANAALALQWIVDDGARRALVTAMKTDPDGGVRSAAVAVLANQLGVGDLMLAALRDNEPSVRQQAAVFLGTRGDQRAIEPLIAALRDSQFDVKVAAAEALGRIGDLRAAKALDALVPADKSKVYYFEKVAAQAAQSIRVRTGEKSPDGPK